MIQVTLRDGMLDALFRTDSAEAAALLSHSLTQLKQALGGQGVSVDRLQVAQAPRSERTDGGANDRNGSQQNGQNAGGFDWERHSDQQRRELIKRMWARLGAGDPLDLVA
jgi:flagellar hook-length control protein FliK